MLVNNSIKVCPEDCISWQTALILLGLHCLPKYLLTGIKNEMG